MGKAILTIDDIQRAKVKARLKQLGQAHNTQDVVDYAMEMAVNALAYCDNDILDVIEKTPSVSDRANKNK